MNCVYRVPVFAGFNLQRTLFNAEEIADNLFTERRDAVKREPAGYFS